MHINILYFFSVLLERANAWLKENTHYHIIKCETIERKIWSYDQLSSRFVDTKFELPSEADAIYYLKGLR